MKKRCLNCGRMYEARKSDQNYCSHECRRMFHAPKQLTLPIKRYWFNMILTGFKQEEYREIKPYWTKRFTGLFGEIGPEESDHKQIIFKNGYRTDSPWLMADCTIRIDTGIPEWGAEEGVNYYVLAIYKVVGGGGANGFYQGQGIFGGCNQVCREEA